MIAVEAEHWFFASPEWSRYVEAYGPHAPHYGPNGNLVLRIRNSEAMWRGVSKGHRAAIKAAKQRFRIDEDFDTYRELHHLANGQVRPEATFDLMRDWIPEHGFVLNAMQGQVAVASAYFIVHGDGAYYASGCRVPWKDSQGAAHLLVWTAIDCLLRHGSWWLDFGPVPTADSTEKERSVFHFKKGFGGDVLRWPYLG